MSEAEHSLAAGVPSGLPAFPSLRFGHWPSPTPMPFRPHSGIAALHPNRTSTLNPDGFSGCAAPASGLAALNLRHRSWVLTLGPATRAKTSSLPGACWRHGGRPGGRRHADGRGWLPYLPNLWHEVILPVLIAIAGSSPKPPPPAMARSLRDRL